MFQGIVYYYRENQVLCRYQATLKELEAEERRIEQQVKQMQKKLEEIYMPM